MEYKGYFIYLGIQGLLEPLFQGLSKLNPQAGELKSAVWY